MIKISHLREMDKVKQLPQEVIKVISSAVTTLDSEYGEERDSSFYGGYVLIVENNKEFEAIKEETYLNLEENAIPEFVDKVITNNGEVYTCSLLILNSDFNIVVVASLELTPDNLKKFIVE